MALLSRGEMALLSRGEMALPSSASLAADSGVSVQLRSAVSGGADVSAGGGGGGGGPVEAVVARLSRTVQMLVVIEPADRAGRGQSSDGETGRRQPQGRAGRDSRVCRVRTSSHASIWYQGSVNGCQKELQKHATC